MSQMPSSLPGAPRPGAGGQFPGQFPVNPQGRMLNGAPGQPAPPQSPQPPQQPGQPQIGASGVRLNPAAGGVASNTPQQAPAAPAQPAPPAQPSAGMGGPPTINATTVYSPAQQQQLITQAQNQNARTAAGANQQGAATLGAGGFAGGSGALAALQGQNAAQQMGANTQAATNIPIQTGAANAQQLLAGQNAQQNQYNEGQQNLLTNQGQQLGFMGNLFSSILGNG